jgi:hypothetical protein
MGSGDVSVLGPLAYAWRRRRGAWQRRRAKSLPAAMTVGVTGTPMSFDQLFGAAMGNGHAMAA